MKKTNGLAVLNTSQVQYDSGIGQDIYKPVAGPMHRCTHCAQGGNLYDNGFIPIQQRYPHGPYCPFKGKF